MILTYEAIDEAGQRSSDVIEAANTAEAVAQLRDRGLFATSVKEAPRAKDASLRHAKQAVAGKLPLKPLMLFTRQMAMLLRAGSAVVPAVAAIKRQASRPAHVAIMDQLIVDLEEGLALTEALRKHSRTFDPTYCAITAAGEATATLPEMFERLSEIVGKRRAMRNKILGAMAYPALLVSMSFSITLMLLLFVLPRFKAMFDQLGVEVPASTQALLTVGDALRNYWFLLVAALFLLGGALTFMLLSRAGRQWISNIQLAIPFAGRLRSRLIQGGIFRTMGTLLECRVGVLDAIALSRESTSNNRFQQMFRDLEGSVTSGGQLSTAFERSGLVEPYICQAVRTGEDSGNVGGAMTYCADILDESNAELVNVLTRMFEPVILIGMGFVVGGVAISLFMPLFDMTSAMQ